MKNLLNYINDIQTSPEEMLKNSLRKDFCRNLTHDELQDLHDHSKLHEKVIAELSEGRRLKEPIEMSERFGKFMKGDEKTIDELTKEAMSFYDKEASPADNLNILNPKTWPYSLWTYKYNKPTLTNPNQDLMPIINKLSPVPVDPNSDQENNNIFNLIKDNITTKTPEFKTVLDEKAFDHYLQGIRDLEYMSWHRFDESVGLVMNLLKKSCVSMTDVSVLLEYCITHEKFVFLLIYPYFFKAMTEVLWSYLYPVFCLTKGSFTHFLKQVAIKYGNIINNKSVLKHGFQNLKISRSVIVTVGTGGISGLLVLYNKFFFKDNTVLIPLYTGMGGLIGQYAGDFRSNGSKLIYEVTKTASTFTNAAVAGFLDPKQDAVRQAVKALMSKKLWL